MKRLVVSILFGTLVMVTSTSHAAVSFDVAHEYQIYDDDRWDGTNRHFGFLFDIGSSLQAGFFFEEANADWRGDVGAAIPNFVNTSSHINGLRVMKKLNSIFSVGLDLATIELSVTSAGGTTATLAGAAPLNQTKPVVDILGRAQYKVAGSRTSSGVYLDFGYRFIDINDVVAAGALGPAAERTLDDLNGVILALGAFLSF